ncbi:MAG: hypothetical protein JRI47_07510 [Deltaproteobacteria bacterium]|nr:hypothetical protein [Deltaproteobacteria bacterium]
MPFVYITVEANKEGLNRMRLQDSKVMNGMATQSLYESDSMWGKRTRIEFPTFREFRRASVAILEKQYLHALTSHAKGSFKKALQASGLSRSRLYGLLKKHHMSMAD